MLHPWNIATPTSSKTGIAESVVSAHSHSAGLVKHSDGKIVVDKIALDHQISKEEFIFGCIDKYIAKSIPLCHIPESLEHRVKKSQLPASATPSALIYQNSRKSIESNTLQFVAAPSAGDDGGGRVFYKRT